MSRLLALVLLVVLAALAAWMLGGRDAPSTALENDAGAARVEATGAGADLVAPASLAARSARAGSTEWDVLVVGPDGAALGDARILAVRAEERLEASGVARWSGLSPGRWTLHVTHEGFLEQQRAVDVEAGDAVRTIVQLGLPCTVFGRVRNTRDEALARHLVLFLRPGERPPANASELRQLPHAVTELDGSFRQELPAEGLWRPVVVFNGRILFEAGRHERLTRERPRGVDVVVSASARLVVDFEGHTGPEDRAPTIALSVYRQPTPAEVARRLELEARRAAITAVEPDLSDPDTAAEVAGARAGENDPGLLAQIEKQKRWRHAAPEGWHSIASTMVPESLRVTLDGLPHDIELRLALRRDDEAFPASEPLFLPYGAIVRAAAALPDPLAAPLDPDAPLRVCAVIVDPSATTLATLVEGATWD